MGHSTKKYDIVVIGGGHNGLTAACLLSQKGRKVLLVEKKDSLGGMAAGEEFYPGYTHNGIWQDTSQLRYPLIQKLNLENYGFKLLKERMPIVILSKQGQRIILYADPEKTIESIAAISKKDAEAYKRYHDFIQKIKGFVQPLFSSSPPDLRAFKMEQLWSLAQKGLALKKLGKETMMELLKVAPMSVADFLDEYFETDFLKAGLAGPAIYGSYTSPRAAFTTLNLLIWECNSEYHIAGGPDSLIKALEKAARQSGVEIMCGTSVEKIQLDEKKIVKGILLSNGAEINCEIAISSCAIRDTFFKFFKPNQLEYSLEQEVLNYRARGTSAKINIAVNSNFSFPGESDENFSFYRTGNSLIDMEKAFDPLKYQKFSTLPVLDIYIPTVENQSLSKEDGHVFSVLIHYTPYNFNWSEEEKGNLYNLVIESLENYFPGLTKAIEGRQIISPKDFETDYGLANGQIFHGEHAIDQLITRPFPSCSQYSTPIEGLYLCGGGSFPGGGISCAPGALAAYKILKT
jgi:phytoene dehydrogenase-like protein